MPALENWGTVRLFAPSALFGPKDDQTMCNLQSHRIKEFLFVVLSVIDLALTLFLIESTNERAYEANPVAAFWQVRYGGAGLAIFKAAIVALVLGLTSVIFRLRPRAAGRILEIGVASLLIVVVYSGFLCHAALLNSKSPAVTGDHSEDAAISADFDQQRAFSRLEQKVSYDVLAGRLTLRQATDRLADTARGRDPEFHKWLDRYVFPNASVSERLAAYVIRSVVNSQMRNPASARTVARRLEMEFTLQYGRAAPVAHRWCLRDSESQTVPPDDGAPLPGTQSLLGN